MEKADHTFLQNGNSQYNNAKNIGFKNWPASSQNLKMDKLQKCIKEAHLLISSFYVFYIPMYFQKVGQKFHSIVIFRVYILFLAKKPRQR